MNPLSRRGVLVAPVLLLGLASLVSSDEEPAARKAPGPPYPTLGATPFPSEYPLPSPRLLPTSKRIAEKIEANRDHPERPSAMRAYPLRPERTKKGRLNMIPIPGGEFRSGSPRKGEGPPRTVRIEPFWMAETEVTWALYDAFFKNHRPRNKDGTLLRDRNGRPLENEDLVDIVTQPTPQYHDLWGDGDYPHEPDRPAMCMTHHAASKFCQWLSAQTGHFYRLPTEAEWEYACRAGSASAYHFGNDPADLKHYAWYAGNSDWTYHPVATKRPNRWGLYDMHGNVAEWVLDGFVPTWRQTLADGTLNPWKIPVGRYPRVVKGGSWDHDAVDLRSAAREASVREWKDMDPNVPKSIWYSEDSPHVGFRIVRPLKTPSAVEMHLFWNTDWWAPERNAEDLE